MNLLQPIYIEKYIDIHRYIAHLYIDINISIHQTQYIDISDTSIYVYVHIKRDHLVEVELSPGGQAAEKYLSNGPRIEGVGENVVEREQFGSCGLRNCQTEKNAFKVLRCKM